MATEIERKFLTTSDNWRTGQPMLIRQGYLNLDKYRTVRVRIAGNEAMLTIKGITIGASRSEFEYSIPIEDAVELLEMCEKPLIKKKRWLVQMHEVTWEIDEFLGANAGLIVAEIELESENQYFEKPAWIGQEITCEPKYYNSNLISHPYGDWKGRP